LVLMINKLFLKKILHNIFLKLNGRT
jgi:hypothetical protein